MTWEIREGDCIEAMREMDEASVDAIVTDPPYGLHFMGKSWDQFGGPTGRDNTTHTERGGAMHAGKYDLSCNAEFQREMTEWATEALRVLKPGGHLLAFGGTRTYHRLTCAVEDAGFEIRDSLIWLYGSGFPKSLDVSKAIDKAAGAEREVVGENPNHRHPDTDHHERWNGAVLDPNLTAPATPEAAQWQGWGTALKPSHEPIVVARKPLAGTVAANVLKRGTGGLNIDGCRIGSESTERERTPDDFGLVNDDGWEPTPGVNGSPGGRWPANVILSPEAAEELDEQSGERMHGAGAARDAIREADETGMWGMAGDGQRYGDTGGASRFFYTAKASRAERNAGLGGFEEAKPHDNAGHVHADGRAWDIPGSHSTARANHHPTVKPIDLMRWLCRLVTPPGGTVLDPFTGSGTTGAAAVLEGFDFIGIEREAEYAEIARARVAFWAKYPGVEVDVVLGSETHDREAHGQISL